MTKISLLSFIWSFIRLQRKAFIFILLLSLIWVVEVLYWPFFLGKLVDIFTINDTERSFAWPMLKPILLYGLGVLILIEGGFRTRDFLYAHAFPKMEADIRMTLFDHVQRHSPKYFNEHFAGGLANKISDMVSTVSIILRNALTLFIPAILICAVSVVVFAQQNALFAWVIGLWMIGHFLLCWFFTLKCAEYSTLHGQVRSTLVGKVVDSLTNNFSVNLMFRFRFEKEYISSYQNEEQQANKLAHVYNAKMFTTLSAAFVIEIVVLTGYLVWYWMYGNIATGDVVQLFYTMFNLSMVVWFIADKAPEFFQALGIARQALSIMHDKQDLLDLPHAVKLSVPKGEIVFENVSFAYGNTQIFQNKNLKISAGEKVGLVGYSGAGKSTFVNLILRFFPLEHGRILIDGQDIANVTLASLRSKIALIPQDPILFHRSLEENIRYGRIDASQEKVIEAAKLAHCDEFIKRCPGGYKALVGERGARLSGGERQRIAIARAMLLEAPILILDEATSALDSVTEKYIQDSLEKLMANRTTLAVAHRLSTLSKMDRILVFDRGSIVEQGSHQELLNLQGHYAQLWQMQAGGFLPDDDLDFSNDVSEK